VIPRPRTPADLDGALCAEIGGDSFYPESGEKIAVRTAKAMCRRCPVLAECLELALANDERYGVWGGTSPADRRRILRGRR
jgi:WhiB family redox-sensing transcriptional regulator